MNNLDPKTEKQVASGCAFAVLLFIIIIGGTCMFDKVFHSTEPATPPRTSPDNSEALAVSETIVKEFLKAPATANFPLEVQAEIIHNDTCMVTGFVDAENSFGANLRSSYTCYFIYQGGDFLSLSSYHIKEVVINNNDVYLDK